MKREEHALDQLNPITHEVDGRIARQVPEGYAFQQRAAGVGFRQAVRERDGSPGHFGSSAPRG